MSSFPNTSFHLKNEQYRLSLLDYEEDSSSQENVNFASECTRPEICSDKEKVIHPYRNDIIAPIWKPKIHPPASHPSREPWRPFHYLCNVLVSSVLTLMFYSCLPIFSTFFMFLGLFPRLLVKLIIRISNGGKLQLMPISRVYGSVNGNNHNVMLVCRGRCDIEKIRAHMLSVINAKDVTTGLGRFSNLLKRVTTKFGYLCLENRAANFDIKNHVRHFNIRSKNVDVDADEIIPYLESTYVQPFDNYLTAPQWEVLLVPKYVIRQKEQKLFSQNAHQNDSMYALIFRFQNGIMDWNMLQELVDEFLGKSRGRVRSIFCPSTKTIGFWKKLQMKIACPLVGPQALLWNIFKGWKSFAGLKSQEGGKISFAATKSISSEAIEDIKDRSHIGTGSILGSCLRIAVRNMALGQNMDFPNSLSVTRVFNSMDNELPGIDWFTAGFHRYRCCLERLHASYHAIDKDEVGLSGQRTFNKIMIQLVGVFPSKVPAWLYRTLTKADVVAEIWPGTDEPCKLFDGDILEDIYGWSGISGSDANFKVTITSYCGRIRANVIGKLGKLAGGLTDSQTIANEFEVEYEHLASTVGIYPQQLYLSPINASSSGMYIS